MNLLLLQEADFLPDGTAKLEGRRLLHAREVLQAAEGDLLKVGRRGGLVGTAEVLVSSKSQLLLRPTLNDSPPPRPGVDLLLAIPRPKALKKVLPAAAALGVDRLVLINAARVEKSYFDSKVLATDFLDGLLTLGLEQAKDTRAPEVLIRERFKPFVEDELDGLFGPGQRLLAHPTASMALKDTEPFPRTVLAIGPEGGWVPFEIELLQAKGFVPVSVGARILRVEVAVPYLLGALTSRPFGT